MRAILLLCLTVFVGCAKPPETSADRSPDAGRPSPAAETLSRPLSPIRFKSIDMGTNVADVNKVIALKPRPQHTKGLLSNYGATKSIDTFGGCKVSSAVLNFWDDQLFEVLLVLENSKGVFRLMQAMEQKYGDYTRQVNANLESFEWTDGTSQIVVTIDGKDYAHVTYAHIELSAAHRAAEIAERKQDL